MSHVGHNSLYESAYHGVPVVAFPLFGDQHSNAKKIVHLGLGLSVHHRTTSVQQVVETIETVITEPRYYFLFLIFHKVRHECKAKRAFETREKGTSRKMKANRKKGMQLIGGCHSRNQLLCKFLETFFTCEKRSTRIFFCTPTWPSFHSTFAT